MIAALINLEASATRVNEHHNVWYVGPALVHEGNIRMTETHSLTTLEDFSQQMPLMLNILVGTTNGRVPTVPAFFRAGNYVSCFLLHVAESL